MQANEAIEKLRLVLKGMHDVFAYTDGPIACAVARANARDALAATATIDPPAAPVLAAVGVEAQQHSDVIPPFAEPASQLALDIRDAARFRALDKRSRYIERPGYRLNIQGDFPWTTLGAYADRLLKWEPESGSFIAPDAEASDPTGSAKGGNTIPEVPAAQPAADHAKRDGCCNNNCN